MARGGTRISAPYVSVAKVLDLHTKLQHVKYDYGTKARLSTPPENIRYLDCSGYVRYVLGNAGFRSMPDGSVAQHNWVKRKGWPVKLWQNLHYAKDDPARLFIWFLEPSRHNVGHVGLVHCGMTLECYGGVGVGRRALDTPVIVSRGPIVYEVPTIERAERDGQNH